MPVQILTDAMEKKMSRLLPMPRAKEIKWQGYSGGLWSRREKFNSDFLVAAWLWPQSPIQNCVYPGDLTLHVCVLWCEPHGVYWVYPQRGKGFFTQSHPAMKGKTQLTGLWQGTGRQAGSQSMQGHKLASEDGGICTLLVSVYVCLAFIYTGLYLNAYLLAACKLIHHLVC